MRLLPYLIITVLALAIAFAQAYWHLSLYRRFVHLEQRVQVLEDEKTGGR
jgi:hypothetical protein